MDDENRIELDLPEEEALPERSNLIDVDLNKEMRTSFLSYSMSVIMQRALPDVRDGLKPVHRRILYTMYENNLSPDKEYRKCADTVGAVLGRYHPHGDASVYDAMVRLAQDFSMRYPLVDGHGNFGSVDGDPPAAYRYTESRMSKMTLKMLEDIDKDTVDFVPNYDDRLKEPTVLPSRIPNLLVNGSMGIAVGMATNIPPHNLGEVVDGMCCVIDNPDCSLEELMEHVKGPDFPTRGIIMGKAGIRAAYATGRGKVTVRARTEIRESKSGKFEIVVTELPYQVNKSRLIESIAELHRDKKIEGLSNVNDYSSRNGMNIVIELKRDANPQVVLNQLFQFTALQSSFGVIMLALVNGEPKILNLKQVLEHYIDHQCEIVRRRTEFDLKKAQDRAHIVEALLKALDFIDEVIAILRASKTIQDGKQNLMDRFEFDDVQATHIVQMRLGQLTGLEREKLEDELGQLRVKIAEYLELLSSHANILAEVKKEAQEVKAAVGDERRTEIVNISGEVDIEDLIPEEDCVFTKTREGYIKRLPVDEYRLQKKGGRGKLGLTTREEDVVDTMFTCSTHAFIMFFTTKGKAYKLKGYEIPEGSRTSKGMNLINLLPMDADEKVSAMLMLPKDEENVYLSMITRLGVIKRTALYDFRNIRKNGIIAINIDEGDVLENVLITHGNDDILVATRNGLGIRFNENDARVLGRTARGVKAVSFKRDDDYVVGAEVIGENETEGRILTVSEDGTGRKSVYDDYRVQSRGGFGSMNYRTEVYGKVAGVEKIYDDEDAILISSAGIIIRLSGADVRECARPAKGVRLIRLGEGDKVIAVTTAKKTPEEPASAIPEGEEEPEEDTVAEAPEADEAPAEEGDEE
ncbi:MAG: DNA gyrase subunit A [Clostridia bacterium]|nr:DNA gyrase subunit A [Clostridia bacterium]MBR5423883.1 DNA gyrase subunit A [Clostridia bacterium]